MKRRDEVLVGIVATAAIGLAVVGSMFLARGGLLPGYVLYSTFDWGSGLRQGQPVMLSGVSVGYVDAVDIRRDSPTFGRWVGFVLSGGNFRQLWIPPGFAHGFCVTSERVHVEYKCTGFYDKADEVAIAWNDPAIGIAWPIATPTLSAKDQAAPPLSALHDRSPR